jgi:hypothetical protein
MKVICFLFAEPIRQDLWGDIFYRYTPQIAFRGKKIAFLEVDQCRRLYSPQSVMMRLLAVMKKMDVHASAAIADDAPTALAFVATGNKDKSQLPTEVLSYFGNPFRVDSVMEIAIQKMVNQMRDLNVRTLGDFEKLNPGEVAARFGALGKVVFENVKNASHLLWPPYRHVDQLLEVFEFDPESPGASMEPLLFQSRRMIENLIFRARGRGERLRRLRLVLDLENVVQQDRLYQTDIVLTGGIVSVKSTLFILQETLSRIGQSGIFKNPNTRIGLFKILVEETIPYKESQRDLLNPHRQEEEENLQTLLARLQTKLGPSAVFTANLRDSFVPEMNWEKNTQNNADRVFVHRHQELQSQTPLRPTPLRPLRLLKHPEVLPVNGNFVWWGKERLCLQNAFRHEVVFSEWWNEMKERSYFCLRTLKGEVLWVFREGAQLYLHGQF